MAIKHNGNNYKAGKGSQTFDVPSSNDIATKEEMETYILNMEPANITASGADLVIEFEPFPQKYINYIAQRQYKGQRTQVFWQLVRYVGKSVTRRTNVFTDSDLSDNSWRFDETSDLYHWTFPTRLIKDREGNLVDGTMKPYVFNMTPEQATQGKIIWYGGYTVVNRFVKRPWLVKHNVTPRKIAVILGVSRHGMRDSSIPWIYKKSNDFEYNDQGPVIPTPPEGIPLLIYNAEVLLEPDGDDYFISFSNIDQDLLNYAEQNKLNKNSAIFVQVFDYFAGSAHKTNRSEALNAEPPIKRKATRRVAKNQQYRLNIGQYELQNGVLLSNVMHTDPGDTLRFKSLKARYKYEPKTFHNISVAMVLANQGMNEGFHTYKESNKINIFQE